MGRITNIKSLNEEKVNVTLEFSQKEVLWLKGNLESMHLFSDNNLDVDTRLVQRGKRESTKYILVPKEFRKDTKPSNNLRCAKIETKTKNFLIFSIDKY